MLVIAVIIQFSLTVEKTLENKKYDVSLIDIDNGTCVSFGCSSYQITMIKL